MKKSSTRFLPFPGLTRHKRLKSESANKIRFKLKFLFSFSQFRLLISAREQGKTTNFFPCNTTTREQYDGETNSPKLRNHANFNLSR